MDKRIVWSFFDDLPHIVFPFRTRTYERHVATDHVPELREFVEAVFSQEVSYTGHTGVVFR